MFKVGAIGNPALGIPGPKPLDARRLATPKGSSQLDLQRIQHAVTLHDEADLATVGGARKLKRRPRRQRRRLFQQLADHRRFEQWTESRMVDLPPDGGRRLGRILDFIRGATSEQVSGLAPIDPDGEV